MDTTWYAYLQAIVDSVDESIRRGDDGELTLDALARRLGYSPYYTTRRFREITGVHLGEYVRQRKLAFALIALRDTKDTILEIAVRYGFSSHEAFTRAFRAVYGMGPAEYRKAPRPVVLRTRINVLDRYAIGIGGIDMTQKTIDLQAYRVSIPAHRFLHIKNYESDGYFDFWEKQDALPGQDCDTICGLLDSLKGKLDGDDNAIGTFSGQVMADLYEEYGRHAEAYGVRLPADFAGMIPSQMLLIDIPEGEYVVFEHGPFDYQSECEPILEKMDAMMASFDYAGAGVRKDHSAGRVAYYYNDPSRFLKRVVPVLPEKS